MTGSKTAAAFGAVLVIGGWLASGVVARRTPQDALPGQSMPGSETVGQVAGEIRVGLRRLAAPERRPVYRAPSRNPFRFQQHEASLPEADTRPNAEETTAANRSEEPPAPQMQLAGIAEDETPGGTIRRAVISAEGELSIVGEGDRVLGRFRVAKISATAVELEDELVAGRLVLHLK